MWIGTAVAYKNGVLNRIGRPGKSENQDFLDDFLFQELNAYVKTKGFNGTEFEYAFTVVFNTDTCVTLVEKAPLENLI